MGYAEASYVFRRTGNMIEDFITIADGTTHVIFNGIDAGTVSNVVYRNTDEAWREYQAIVLQSRYRFDGSADGQRQLHRAAEERRQL